MCIETNIDIWNVIVITTISNKISKDTISVGSSKYNKISILFQNIEPS